MVPVRPIAQKGTVMKLGSLLLALVPLAAPALAQQHQHHDHKAAAAPVTAPAAAPRFTLDTPIEAIVADPAGKAALDGALPGISDHPAYDMFKAMTLKQLEPLSDGKITPELLAKAEVALAAVP
jgi:hypothetical protein